MNDVTRRNLLRAGAGTAVAVPASILSSKVASAADAAGVPLDLDTDRPVLFCVHDAAAGEVSILHGTAEVIVRDKRLAARLLRAAAAVSSADVVSATADVV
jgi:hypothetical protein